MGSEQVSSIAMGSEVVWSATPPSKTLVVQYVEESTGFGADRSCGISNVFDFASTYDDINMQPDNTLTVYGSFSGSYSNYEITIVGPFSAGPYTLNCGGISINGPCYSLNNTISFSFSGDSATVQADYTETGPEPECECIEQGGTWDGSECQYEEDPCINDPCMCDPNPDECYCIQGGGVWDGSECIY